MLSLVADVEATKSFILPILGFVNFETSLQAAEVDGCSLSLIKFSEPFSEPSSTLRLTLVTFVEDFLIFLNR